MRVVVCGGREFLAYDFLAEAMDVIHHQEPITELAHGAQKAWMQLTKRWRGVDYYAGVWAESRGVPVVEFPVSDEEWKRYARAAGPIRNRRMIDTFKPDRVYAFPGNKGTKDCVTYACDKDYEVWKIDRTDDGRIAIIPVSNPRLF